MTSPSGAGFRARWNGEEYSAGVDAAPEGIQIHLYRTTPAPGFDTVRPDRFVRTVPEADCEAITYVTMQCQWRGAPFQLVDERDEEVLLEYTGGLLPVAQSLGLERIERGVHRAWVRREEIQAMRESAVPVQL